MRHRWITRAPRKILTLATDYTWAFVAIMAVTLVSCFFSIYYLSTLESDLKEVYENDVRGGDAVQSAYTSLLGLESALKDLVLFHGGPEGIRARKEVKERTEALKTSMNAASPRFVTPKARQALQRSKTDLKAFLVEVQGFVGLTESGIKPGTKELLVVEQKSRALQKDLDLLVANRLANSSQGIRELVGQLRISLIVTIVILVITVGVRVVLYIAGHPHLNRRKSDREPAP